MKDPPVKYYTIKEAALLVGVSDQLLRAYCRAGVFPEAYMLRGTRWRIPSADLQALLNDELDLSGLFSRKGK